MYQGSKIERRYFKSRRRHRNKRCAIRKHASRERPIASRAEEATEIQQKS